MTTIIQNAQKALEERSRDALSAWTSPKERRLVWLADAKDIIASYIEEAYRSGVEDGRADYWEKGYRTGVLAMANSVSSAVNKAIIDASGND